MGHQSREVEVLVIGAGQAGLAVARALAEAGLHAIVYERHARVGDSWRKRYESLVIFTPRRYSALPGLALDGDPDGFPHKDELADYLERYAQELGITIATGNGIARLQRHGAGFEALTNTGSEIHARAVLVTTGAFQVPKVPDFAAGLGKDVLQLDAATYKSPSSLPEGPVVVAGDGATGRQIALELCPSRQVTLAMGRRRQVVPQTILGQDLAWWSDHLGLYWADKDTWLGRRVRAADAFPGLHLRAAALRRAGVALRPRVLDGSDDELTFADGSRMQVRTVVWATGYRDDTSWMAVPGAVTSAAFVQARGVTPVAGLFHVGREWQNNRASALLCGVHRDASAIAARVKRHLEQRSPKP